MVSQKMNFLKKPKVAVLLAAYNGEKYIEEQIQSILDQKNIDAYIYISIDESTDKTLEICENLKKSNKQIQIIQRGDKKFGSAGQNFYNLFINVNFEYFEFIALSDQDDIWKPSKIIRGIEVINSSEAAAYSSDVECFWEDKKYKNKLIKKSHPQKEYDYYFEPAGPGCTYIITKELATAIKNKILTLKKLPFHHDWFFYAFARSNSFKWVIDDQANILYRQHSSNQVGANFGIKSKLKRFKIIRSGIYQEQSKEILKSISIDRKEIIFDILKNPFKYRRKNSEATALFFFTLFGWIK